MYHRNYILLYLATFFFWPFSPFICQDKQVPSVLAPLRISLTAQRDHSDPIRVFGFLLQFRISDVC